MKKTTSRQIISSDVKPNQVRKKLENIGKVIMVGSGKGGVGKSFVACGLALTLAYTGRRVGLFDIDIHGASVANYLDVKPPVRSTKEGLEPKRVDGNLEVMSVALLTGNNPVPMRGMEKQDMITQFFSLINWGKLDFLVVDLPPSTGDELLSAFSIFGSEKSSLILVSTPSRNAVSIVSRLSALAKTENISVRGIVLNMAYSKVHGTIEYPFGRGDRTEIERALGSRILAEIPLEPTVNTLDLQDIILARSKISGVFRELIHSIVS